MKINFEEIQSGKSTIASMLVLERIIDGNYNISEDLRKEIENDYKSERDSRVEYALITKLLEYFHDEMEPADFMNAIEDGYVPDGKVGDAYVAFWKWYGKNFDDGISSFDPLKEQQVQAYIDKNFKD